MASEEELCRLLARGELSVGARTRALSLLAGPVSWTQIVENARTFDILPQLYHNLQSLGFAGVPESARAQLGQIFATNALRNELLARELCSVLHLFAEARLPVMTVKGLALVEALYGDLALRTCADLDLLVPSHRVADAFKLLASSGYEPEFSEPTLLDLLARYGKDCELTRAGGSITYRVELHCGLIWGGPLERAILDEIWADAAPIAFRGAPALALGAVWQFLYVAEHAARHGPPSLKWLADLDRLCRTQSVDWKTIGDKAQRLGWEKAVSSSLLACASLFDTPIGPGFSAMKRPHVRDAGATRSSDFQPAWDALFSLRLLKSWKGKAQYLAIRLFVPTAADCRWVKLPPRLFFLYYALRSLRLAGKAAAWALLFGKSKLTS